VSPLVNTVLEWHTLIPFTREGTTLGFPAYANLSTRKIPLVDLIY